MFCEKYYKKLLNYAKKDQIWADPNCPYRRSLWIASQSRVVILVTHRESASFFTIADDLSKNKFHMKKSTCS